ncbi:sorting nexin-32-like [Tubulanus polymorphus]|uniref:sorting nexin-32-like n=1 Tax=Tubulanus polymorphus TaxID=672921 RepID=UPI003DA27427
MSDTENTAPSELKKPDEKDDVKDNGNVVASNPSPFSSSPIVEPFEPAFTNVCVCDATKDGDVVKYSVTCNRTSGGGQKYDVIRQYEDFEWLSHCILTHNNTYGIIAPPLPPKPIVEPKTAERQSREQLGTTSRLVKADDYMKDCRNLEKYLKLVITHWAFGKDKTLDDFLTCTESLNTAKVKKGIFGRLTSSIDQARKFSRKDIDDYFQKERDWLATYSQYLHEASRNFNKNVYATLRLSIAYSHLATAMSLGASSYADENSAFINKLCAKLGEAYEDMKQGLEVDYINEDNTLGFQLDLYARYLDSEKEMQFKRLCLMTEYEDAIKACEKAKPQKRAAAEEAKQIAEKVYEQCSDRARSELKAFHQQRLFALQDGIVQYADAKIKTARDTYALLAKTLTAIKQL